MLHLCGAILCKCVYYHCTLTKPLCCIGLPHEDHAYYTENTVQHSIVITNRCTYNIVLTSNSVLNHQHSLSVSVLRRCLFNNYHILADAGYITTMIYDRFSQYTNHARTTILQMRPLGYRFTVMMASEPSNSQLHVVFG